MADHIPNVLEPFAAPYATREERKAHAQGLRALADWLETTRFPIPAWSLKPSDFQVALEINSFFIDDPGFVKRAGSAARLIGGRVDKSTESYGTRFLLEREFGGGVVLRYYIARDAVCEAVEVTKPVERQIPTDAERAAEIQAEIERLTAESEALDKTTVTESVTVTEFQCPEALLPRPIEQEATAA